MENLSHIAEDELSSIIQALSSHPEWVSEIRTQCDKLKHYPFPQLPKSWERLLESLIAADNNGPEPLQRGSYDIDNTVSRFKPGTEINDDIVNAYICLLRFATNTLRQKLMSTRFFSSLRNIHAREVDEEVTASTFRTLEKIIIPIYSNNHFTFAVIRNKQEEVHIELHDSLLSSENPDTSLETLEAWVKDTVGHDIRIYTQNLETPQVSSPVECGYFVLISIRVEAFGYCALSEEETAQIMPQAGKQILSELLASQLNPNEADFVAFSSDKWTVRSLEHHDPSSEVLTSSPTTSGPEEYSALHNQSPAVGSTSHGTKRPCPSSGRAPKRTRLNGDGPYRGKPPSHSSTRPGEGYTQDSIGVGERYAQEFADLSTLLKTLPAIVYKLRHPSCSHSDFIASRDLAYLWSSRKCPAKPLLEFNDRIERGHFSQIFNSNMLEIEQITEAESTEYIGLFNRKLGITTPGQA